LAQIPLSLLAVISLVSLIQIGSVDFKIACSTLLLNAAGVADLDESLDDRLFDKRFPQLILKFKIICLF
jgi:hypothetical protein